MREKVKEDETGFEIADAGSLSSATGEGAGAAQIRRIPNHESFRQKNRDRPPTLTKQKIKA
jgi:hypothetical protein